MTTTEPRTGGQKQSGPESADRVAAIENMFSELAADPVAMLPVRIETRFVQLRDVDPLQLKIRVFPEQLHVDAHVAGISPDEREAGINYWINRVNISPTQAWNDLLLRVDAPRAAWVVESLTPTNLSSVKDTQGSGHLLEFPDTPVHEAPWTEPPMATALPSRWIIAGYRDGQRVLLEMTEVVPEELSLGPETDPSLDDAPQTQDRPVDVQTELPIEDDAMRWLTDYDRAVEVGMALTVEDGDVTGGLHAGFDSLLVLGLPRGGADTMDTLLTAHRHTDGLAFLRQGTATNNTAAVPSGFDSAESELAKSLDPAVQVSAVSPGSGAERLATALAADQNLLSATLGGDATEDAHAARMAGLLWETTWGYFLDQYLDPVVDDAAAALMRDHFVRYVRGRGPLSAIRIGQQPLGVLPVVSGQHFHPDDQVEARVHQLLGHLTGLWGHAGSRFPGLAKSFSTDADLLDVLESTPHSVSLRARAVVGPTVAANVSGMTRFSSAAEAVGNWLGEMVFAGQRFRGASMMARAKSRRLRLPFVTKDPLSETDPLSPNYLFQLQVMLRRGGVFSDLQSFIEPTLLAILIRQSAQLVFGRAAAGLVMRHRLGQVPPKLSPLEVEFRSLGQAAPDGLADYAMNPYAPISGTQTMADYLAGLSLEELAADPITEPLARFIEDLDEVANLPSAELDRLTAETIDLCSHRIDAWHTSLATRRLEAVRAADADRLHVGGFGWLHDLRRETAPDSLGYVHAPSIGQATTAAVLRSGHLAHRENGGGSDDRFAIDLSAPRVRTALDLMDGVRSGQSLAAMLGYRFERGLREQDIELAGYILDYRKAAPLVRSAGPNQTEPLESMAARDVVDGMRLLELRESLSDEAFFGSPVAGSAVVTVTDQQHRNGIAAVLGQLADQLDAVSDILVAESVHQTVHGNLERGTAALDALDRQGPPPDPEVVRSTRTGVDVANRLLVSLTDSVVAAGWPTTLDLRAQADPRLNAWVSRLLGNPSRIRFAAEIADMSIDDEALQVVEVVETSLDQLGLSPLSVLWASAEGGATAITELDERIARQLMTEVTVGGDRLELRILEGDQALATWPADTIGLAGLHALLGPIRDLISSARPSQPDDLVDPNSDDEGVVDQAEHAARADAALAALEAAAAEIDRLIAARIDDPAVIENALNDAAEFGVGGVLPGGADNFGRQLADASRVLNRRITEAEASDEPGEALRSIFGASVVTLPMFTPPEAAELSASLGDATSLLGGDTLAPTTWLQQSALVRPGAARLAAVLRNAEAIGAEVGSTDLDVVQLPHQPGDRWVALPLNGSILPAGNVGIAIHAPGGFDPATSQAGLVVDEWNEDIPNPVETSGVSFHYDAPGTRAPQTMLLAVPADRSANSWSLDELLSVLDETLNMSLVRAVDPQRLWMMNTALPAIYMSANSKGDATSANVYQAEAMYRAQAGIQTKLD